MNSHVPVVKFGKFYPKLQDRFFNTIRKTTSLEKGMTVTVQVPMEQFTAKVSFVKECILNDIPTSTLTYDTDTLCREDALNELQFYYPYLTWNSSVCLIGFRRES